MLEETLARLGDSVRVDRLEPFAVERPLRCVVALRRIAADQGSVAPNRATDDHGTGDRPRRRRAGRQMGGVTRG